MGKCRIPKSYVRALLGLCAVLVALLLYKPSLFLALPTADAIREQALAPSSMILDRNGQVLYEIIDPRAGLHRPVSLEEMPLALRQAIIATEDATFYDNPGINPRAIARALWTNLRQGRIVSGGSTITQQLARNLLLSPSKRYEKSWQRKIHESVLAYHMTRSLSKDEILALYLNETYFGNMAYGVEAAARAYFGKPVGQLDLAECALLAGLPQAPTTYNPLTNLSAAKTRQRIVLNLMVKAGYIAPAQADLTFREPLGFGSSPFAIEAPHFCMLVREELQERLGERVIRQGGLRVHTTLDLDLQRASEAHLSRHLAEHNKQTPEAPSHNMHNAALVVLAPGDGAVRVMIGSPDYFDPDISGALNASLSLRQPGSAIKPLTYAAAFEQGYSPSTMIADVRTSFLTSEGQPYVPINYDYRFHGPVSLRQALACSYNVATVKLLDEIGIDTLPDMARRLGVNTLNRDDNRGLALTLGSGEVQLLQLTAAYGAFANGGYRVSSKLIDYIENSEGVVIYRATQETMESVLDERVAYLVTDILSDNEARVPAFGDHNVLELPFPAAVKTGTTTDWRDNWTVGYTTDLVTGVWVGNADNAPMLRVSGVSGAAPIWNAVMRSAHRDPPRPFVRPPGLVEVKVCAESGLLPGSACPHRKREIFIAENVPTGHCQMHRLVAFDSATGLVASASCPPGQRVLRSVTFWPPEALSWAEEQGLPLPPDGTKELLVASHEGEQARLDLSPAIAYNEPQRAYLSSPDPNSSFTIVPNIPMDYQKIEIAASCPTSWVQGLSLWVDGQEWHTWKGPPYRVFWPLSPGIHEFYVKSGDHSEHSLSSLSIYITVHAMPDEQERTSP